MSSKSPNVPSKNLAERMMESKKQSIRSSKYAYKNDVSVKEIVAKLREENTKRGTPIIT
jgi:hypothetical protein